jgi:hypothetical protein
LILQDLENKEGDFQDIQNNGVMAYFELWETQACGWWILSRPELIIRGVSRARVGRLSGFAALRTGQSRQTSPASGARDRASDRVKASTT